MAYIGATLAICSAGSVHSVVIGSPLSTICRSRPSTFFMSIAGLASHYGEAIVMAHHIVDFGALSLIRPLSRLSRRSVAR